MYASSFSFKAFVYFAVVPIYFNHSFDKYVSPEIFSGYFFAFPWFWIFSNLQRMLGASNPSQF